MYKDISKISTSYIKIVHINVYLNINFRYKYVFSALFGTFRPLAWTCSEEMLRHWRKRNGNMKPEKNNNKTTNYFFKMLNGYKTLDFIKEMIISS